MALIGFIGMGNMGYSILKGIQKDFLKDDIVFHSNTEEKMKKISKETLVKALNSNAEVVREAKYIILAIKPQMFENVIGEISDKITSDKVFVSLAPGYTIDELKCLMPKAKIVRTMPNTPALVGEGMTGICYKDGTLDEDEQEIIKKIFSSFGKMKVIDEKDMNCVVCASGSSPAYVFAFMESLIDSVVKHGMTKEDAYDFVVQTVLGSAKLMMETKKEPKELKDMVCSPGGTTIEGVKALEEYGFDNAISKATDACYKKCTTMK